MKIYIALCLLSTLAMTIDAYPMSCACAPGPPVCASNGKTYYGECNMNCASQNLGIRLYVIYYGSCEDLFIGSHNPGVGTTGLGNPMLGTTGLGNPMLGTAGLGNPLLSSAGLGK